MKQQGMNDIGVKNMGKIFEGIPNTRERTYTIPGTRSVTDEKA
jgi:hypothetical protein